MDRRKRECFKMNEMEKKNKLVSGVKATEGAASGWLPAGEDEQEKKRVELHRCRPQTPQRPENG